MLSEAASDIRDVIPLKRGDYVALRGVSVTGSFRRINI